MPKAKNITIATELKEKLGKAKSLVLTDYRGMTHKQAEDLHRFVKKAEAEYVVVKNSLLCVASKDTRYKIQDTKDLIGPTGALLSYGDEILPLKELAKFIKTTTLPKIKFGYVGGQRYSGIDIENIAKLPGKEVLQGQLVGRLSSPIFGLVYSLNYNISKLVYILGQISVKQ